MPQENQNTENTNISHTQLFDQALALQQANNLDSALETYQKLLDLSQNNLSTNEASAIYHNMSNIAHEKGDHLKAYVWSKKSLSLNPSNHLASESFSIYSKNIEIPTIAHQISSTRQLKGLITKVSIDAWLILSLILIFSTLSLILKNWIARKKNQFTENILTLASWPIYILLALCFTVISTTYICFQETKIAHAIVIVEKAQVQTAAGENKPIIFEAQAGLELEVLNFDQGYFQVRYPGAFSGWIRNSQLEILSLGFKQDN